MKFDLMHEKPVIDIPTINYIWDALWRINFCVKPTNADLRARHSERERIMEQLQEMANSKLREEVAA